MNEEIVQCIHGIKVAERSRNAKNAKNERWIVLEADADMFLLLNNII